MPLLPRRPLPRLALLALACLALLAAAASIAIRVLLAPASLRATLEAQASGALGAPVTVASARATLVPRVGLHAGGVEVGRPARVRVDSLLVETGLLALLRGRVEDARLRVSKAHLHLPLPPAPAPETPSPAPARDAPHRLTIASVSSLVVEDLRIERGGETLGCDLEGSLQGEALELSRIALRLGRTSLGGTARLASWRHLAGSLALEGDFLDVDALVRFGSAGEPEPAPAGRRGTGSPSPPPRVRLEGTLKARQGVVRSIAFQDLDAAMVLEGAALRLDRLQVRLLEGRAEGTARLDGTPGRGSLGLKLRAAGIDLEALSRALGSPGAASGKLDGSLELRGAGPSLADAGASAAGSARVAVAGLRVKQLDLAGAALRHLGAGPDGTGSPDGAGELTATASLGKGLLRTEDARLVTPELEARARGSLSLAGHLDLRVECLLSEAVSGGITVPEARYARQGGRVVLPLVVQGPVSRPKVSVDAAALARRAAGVALEEQKKAVTDKLTGGLRKLFGK